MYAAQASTSAGAAIVVLFGLTLLARRLEPPPAFHIEVAEAVAESFRHPLRQNPSTVYSIGRVRRLRVIHLVDFNNNQARDTGIAPISRGITNTV